MKPPTRRGRIISPDLPGFNPRRGRRLTVKGLIPFSSGDNGRTRRWGYVCFAPVPRLVSSGSGGLSVPPRGPNPRAGSVAAPSVCLPACFLRFGLVPPVPPVGPDPPGGSVSVPGSVDGRPGGREPGPVPAPVRVSAWLRVRRRSGCLIENGGEGVSLRRPSVLPYFRLIL